MSLLLPILLQAAAPTPVVENVQLACTVAMPGAQPVAMNVDLRTKKRKLAALVANAGPLTRVTLASPAVVWPGGNNVAFVAATGSGRYRVELQFTGARERGASRVRIVSLGDGPAPLAGQGFCLSRAGKQLPDKKLKSAAFDATQRASAPVRLQANTPTLPPGTCRVVAADRRVFQIDYRVLSAARNEATVSYRIDQPTLTGGTGGIATGVLFNLASPRERMYSLTASLGGEPPLYVHQTFERSGVWVDLKRGNNILGLGECGATAPALLAMATPQ